MLPLPAPERGGTLDGLRPFVNVADDRSWLLLLGWLVAAYRRRGPFPALALCGEQGSCKTTLGRLLQQLVDPSAAELRGEPREPRDLMIAATNAWLVAYDNLSHLPQWLSDALCRLATGGGFSARQLYTDDEEAIFVAQRPALLTSIADVVTSADLLDRAVCIQLEPVPDDRRRTEQALLEEFGRARPRLLGALLDAASAGLRNLPATRLARLPRMADFALWAEASLRGAGFRPGDFLAAYEANRGDTNALALEASPVALALLKRLEDCPVFDGTAAELLQWLNDGTDERTRKEKGWPTRPHVLSGQLRRMAPNLRRAGVSVRFERTGHDRRRTIHLARRPQGQEGAGRTASAASAASAPEGDGTATEEAADGYSHADGCPPGDRGASAERPNDQNADAADGRRAERGRTPRGRASAAKPGPGIDLPPDADLADAPGPPLSAVAAGGLAYTLVRSADGLRTVSQALDESDVVGLDTETTGLDPRADRVRLLQLATDRGVFVVDCFAADPRPLFDALAGKELVAHNAAFDLQFLARLGFAPDTVRDTMLLSQLLHGTRKPKGFHGLAAVLGRELDTEVGKAEQTSDWSGALAPGQFEYAARDVAFLLPLYRTLSEKIRDAGLGRVAGVESRCLPAVAWLARSGVPFDRAAWEAPAREARAQADALAVRLDDAAPARDGCLTREGAWNWNAPEQVKEAFARAGVGLDATDDDSLAGCDHPLADLLRRYRAASRLATTYGPRWLRHVAPDGRVYAGWRQIGSDAGRMSCSAPNLQQLPRLAAYRRCVRAPEGRVLVKADYSQIELRVAARVSGDPNMLDAYRRGEDLHALTARRVLGTGEVTKEHRQLAKALNFGLLYGMGALGFRRYARAIYGLALTDRQARDYRQVFFDAYPGLAAWHRKVRRDHQPVTWTLGGRRRLIGDDEPDTYRLNSPVQGTGSDGLKAALALLWERRAGCPGAFPVLAVHDEIVVECDAGGADAAGAWLKEAMLDGMAPLIDPVPVEVEVSVGGAWGGD
jgi:DNA polymerase-1